MNNASRHQNTTFQYASGGFGSISLDLVNNRIVKRSQKEGDTTLQQELAMYQRLGESSDYIVKLLGVVRDPNDKPTALFLERCDCDARYYKQRGFLSQQILDVISLQLLEAVIFMHSRQVIHCDLKPSNILICFDTQGGFIVKICDFGLSETQNGSAKHCVKGTSGYVDPRVIINRIPYSPISDMWACAISLLMLTDRYNHAPELQTKNLKKTVNADELINLFYERIKQEVLIHPSVAGVVINALITTKASAAQTLGKVIDDLSSLQLNKDHLLQAQFKDSEALGRFPFFEYFKIRDGVRVYLVDRKLVIADNTDTNPQALVLSAQGIYFTSPEFVERVRELLVFYQERFGFALEGIKMKSNPIPLVTQVTVQNSEVSFVFQGSLYVLFLAKGHSEVHIGCVQTAVPQKPFKHITIKSEDQARFIVTPQLNN